jgi:hypothetical protein
MKKLISILCVAMVVIGLSSCTKKYILPNPNQTIIFDVPVSSWVLSTDGKSYYSVLSTPEIDSYFNDNGGVLVYFSFTDGVYEQVPEVYNGVSYSYTHNKGSIVLYAQTPDGTTPIKPDPLTLKLLLLSSDQ